MTIAAGERPETIEAAEAGQRWLEGALAPEERAGLAQQGFIAFHTLPSGNRCAKLRFRDSSGRQRVRYLGINPQLADAVAAALKARQHAVRIRRASTRRARCSRQALREVRCRLESPLGCAGWHFHGLSLRRRRSHTSAAGACCNELPHLRSSITMDNDLQEPLGKDGGQDVVRRQVFDDLRRSALEQIDPVVAALHYEAANLMDLSALLCEPIKAALHGAPDVLEAIADLTPDMEIMLKLSRQADRLLNVSLKQEMFPPVAKAKIRHFDTYVPVRGRASTSPPAEADSHPPAATNRPR